MRGRTLVVRLMLETNVRNTSYTTGNKTYHDTSGHKTAHTGSSPIDNDVENA